jgi:RNA ligase (TIGR02306 family)
MEIVSTQEHIESNTDTKRYLSSLEVIENIQPIPDSDNIELATILSQPVVVQKSRGFQAGDKVVFVASDAILPAKPEFEFLAGQGYRVKVTRIRGQVSMGVVFKPEEIPELETLSEKLRPTGVSLDSLIGIRKYEAPVFESSKLQTGRPEGKFPEHTPKTDEENIQKMKWILEELHGEEVVLGFKYDGSSASIFLDKDGDFGVCSRNNRLKSDGGGDFWAMARKYDLERKMRELGMSITVQAEVIGPGIQKNKHGLKEKELRVHNVFDNNLGRHLDYDERVEVAEKLGLPVVQEHSRFILDKNVHTIEKLVEMATIPDFMNPQNPCEGLVMRPTKEKRVGKFADRASVKVLNPEFKLKFANG